MKIILFTARFRPEGMGGTEVLAYHLAKGLAQNGHEVLVLASGGKQLPAGRMPEGFSVERIPYPRIPFFGMLVFLLRAPWRMRKFRPDVVHCLSVNMGISAMLSGLPYTVWCVGLDVNGAWKFKGILLPMVLGKAAAVASLTVDMKNKVQRFCRQEITLVPSGVDVSRFGGLEKSAMRVRHEIPADRPVIVFVNRLVDGKGVEHLLAAMELLTSHIPHALLLLVGEGDRRGALQRAAKNLVAADCVRFLGAVPHDQVPEYLAAADAFVLPSFSEGMPVSLVEAIAAGLPVVASNIPGIAEVVADTANALLVPPGEAEALAEALAKVLENKEAARAMGDANREKAKQYAWGRITDAFEKLFASVSQSQ